MLLAGDSTRWNIMVTPPLDTMQYQMQKLHAHVGDSAMQLLQVRVGEATR